MSRSSGRKSPRLGLVVGATATSLILVAMSGCVADNPTTNAAAKQPASASPAASKVRGPIPVGTPVVLYWRRVSPDGLYAASWTGALYKVPTINFAPGSLAVQSPDGSRLAIGDRVHDTTSGATTQLPFDGAKTDVAVTWADDSRHVCLTRPLLGEGSPSEISYDLPGSPAVVLGGFGSHGQQVPGATVLACSATSNRVVVANVGGDNETSDAWVLDTTTGAILYHRTYPQRPRPAATSVSS